MINLYQDIVTKVQQNVPEIRHIDLFRNQFIQLESGNNQMKAFKFPCLFVSFENGITYDSFSYGLQKGKINIRIYVGFEKLTEAFTELNAIFAKITACLTNLSGLNYDNLVKVFEKYDENHSNLYVWILDFEANYTDYSVINKKNNLDVLVQPVSSNVIGEWR